jgi:acetyl esterase
MISSFDDADDAAFPPLAPVYDHMPTDLAAEIAAIRAAISGDRSSLEVVLRNKPPRSLFPGVTTTDLTFSGPTGPFTVRSYLPGPSVPDSSVILFMHGGGWVFGSCDRDNFLPSKIAAVTHTQLLSVDYALYPGPDPTLAIDQCLSVWKTISRKFVILAGDSCGGHLAACLALKIRTIDPNAKLATIILYPVLDLTPKPSNSRQSYGSGYNLDNSLMDIFIDAYTPHQKDRENPALSPIRADLNGFPPTLIIGSQCDILRDEGLEFARKVETSGGVVRYRCLGGAMHGFASDIEPATEKFNAIMDDEIRNFVKAIGFGK